MRPIFLKPILMALIMVAGGAVFSSGAPAAQEPRNQYGMFKIIGYAMRDPTRGFCGSHCKSPNPQLNSTYIHSPVFRLPEADERVDLWETGKEFCRRARRQMGEGWWKLKGMPDCIDGALSYYPTQERAFEELQKLYSRAQKETRPDYLFEVFEFTDFQPKKVKLFVLRFPGSVPAPVQRSGATTPSAQPGYAVAAPTPPAVLSPAQPESMPVTSAQELAEIATRERLNREQAAFAQRQLAENAAAKAAFEQATADRAATIARQQAEYEAQVAAVEAEKQRRERAYAAALEKWQADVAACKAGDVSRCGQPQP
jgi:fused signal recognition particle receptor